MTGRTAFGATLSFAMGSAKVGNPYPQLSFHLRGGLSAMGQSEICLTVQLSVSIRIHSGPGGARIRRDQYEQQY